MSKPIDVERLPHFLGEIALFAPTIAVAAEELGQLTAASLLRLWAAEAKEILAAATPTPPKRGPGRPPSK